MELETTWSFEDALIAHELLDSLEEARAEAQHRAEKERERAHERAMRSR